MPAVSGHTQRHVNTSARMEQTTASTSTIPERDQNSTGRPWGNNHYNHTHNHCSHTHNHCNHTHNHSNHTHNHCNHTHNHCNHSHNHCSHTYTSSDRHSKVMEKLIKFCKSLRSGRKESLRKVLETPVAIETAVKDEEKEKTGEEEEEKIGEEDKENTGEEKEKTGEEESSPWGIEDLPEELLLYIFGLLGRSGLMRAARVCQLWRRVATTRSLWACLCERYHLGVQYVDDPRRVLSVYQRWRLCRRVTRDRAPTSMSQRYGVHAPHPCRILSADGQYVVTTCGPSICDVWNLANGSHDIHMAHLSGEVICARICHGLLLISTSEDSALSGWKVQSRRLHLVLEGHSSWSADVHGDGRYIVTAGTDRRVGCWHFGTGRRQRMLVGHAAPVQQVRCMPHRAVSMDRAHNVILWDLQQLQPLRHMPLRTEPLLCNRQPTLRASSQYFAYSIGPDSILLVEPTTGRLVVAVDAAGGSHSALGTCDVMLTESNLMLITLAGDIHVWRTTPALQHSHIVHRDNYDFYREDQHGPVQDPPMQCAVWNNLLATLTSQLFSVWHLSTGKQLLRVDSQASSSQKAIYFSENMVTYFSVDRCSVVFHTVRV